MSGMTTPRSRERRSEYLQSSFTPTERRLIEQHAQKEDRTVSDVIRRATLGVVLAKGKR